MRPPNPGSDEAVDAGCTCPVLDNSHGEGMPGLFGKKLFWVNGDCPLHALRVIENEKGGDSVKKPSGKMKPKDGRTPKGGKKPKC